MQTHSITYAGRARLALFLRNSGQMKISHAFYLASPRRGICIMADGQPAIIKLTKKSLLDRGIAALADIRDAEFPWVANLAYHLNGDETDLDPSNKIIGGTDDPVIVCMARRYWEAIHENKVPRGSAPIPTLEEASAESEELVATTFS